MAKQSFLGRSLFWTIMIIFLIIAFGHSSKNYELTFFFVTSLLPIAIATSWFFNHFLVPRYLQPGKYLKFGIYLTYTMIVSLWLEMIIAILAFIFLANYDYANMTPQSTNLVYLGLWLYFIVFVDSFRHTFLQMQSRQRKIDSFSKESITVNSQEIPISRTFKEKAMEYLEAGVEKRRRYGTA